MWFGETQSEFKNKERIERKETLVVNCISCVGETLSTGDCVTKRKNVICLRNDTRNTMNSEVGEALPFHTLL